MSRFSVLLLCLALTFSPGSLLAQYVHIDSVAVPKKDTGEYAVKPHRDPRKATIRSAIIPGWGQIYNHKYWKVPIVWGGLTACVIIFNYNLTQYNMYRHIYSEMIAVGNGDSSQYRPADSIYFQRFNPQDIQYARNSARQYVDYSAIAFLLVWGLNIVDATVDAHLHEFDVSDDLTLKIQPKSGFTDGITGLGLVLDIHPPKKKHPPLQMLASF